LYNLSLILFLGRLTLAMTVIMFLQITFSQPMWEGPTCGLWPTVWEAMTEKTIHLICDTGSQNLSFVLFGFLLNHILHCSCFKILFTVSKYLVSNWNYSEIIQRRKGLYSVSNKTNGIKIGLQLYNLWQSHGHQLNWRITNTKTPLLYLSSSSISRKQQTTGFEPLRHIWFRLLPFLFVYTMQAKDHFVEVQWRFLV